jgi:glycosyltransferase involved in cell wall biosynthesis
MNVSVVIPAWNAAETIAATLDSLLAQGHRGWEAIVVDDGSGDGTAAIARDYAERDRRIRLVQQDRGGEASARNTGLAEARFDWLLFLDSDDWIAPAYLARMTAELCADPALDAVHCGYARVAADGTQLVDPYEAPEGDMFATWARRSAFPVHACVVRRDLVTDVGGFDASLEKSADWDLWQRVARTGARFGAVREPLAFYRMRPSSASLEAPKMLRDGLRVLRRGHAPDARVSRPHPDHANGAPPDQVRTQAWYLLSWCAGLMIARDQDARPLIELCDVEPFPELHPPAVAQAIWNAAPLPLCEPPRIWTELWLRVHERVDDFLGALEVASGAEGLAARARAALVRSVLSSSPAFAEVTEELEEGEAHRQQMQGDLEWRDQRIREMKTSLTERDERIQQMEGAITERDGRIGQMEAAVAERDERIREAEASLEERDERIRQIVAAIAERDDWAREMEARLAERDDRIQGMEERIARLDDEARSLAESRDRVTAERNVLQASLERRTGDFILNRLRLRGVVHSATSLTSAWGQRLGLAGLRIERALRPRRRRLMTTVCWNFPIHSQTFVYQELTHLIRHGFDVRLVYSKLEPRDQLPARYGHLWPLRRRLFLNRAMHERNYQHYRRRMEGRVETLIVRLCAASGLTRDQVERHGNFLEAFTFTRMVEAYRPDYLHSYFFYDRSLMALVAAYLLELPRGVSCYADHVLRDYELKVVPLHVELCDVVIATSQRIREELMEIAPHVDPTKILVKPNGIDPDRFPQTERKEPGDGQPFRVVSVCRIEPKKGLLDLVEAVHLLRRRGINVEAHLVGAADEWSAASVEYARRLHERVTDLGLVGAVHLEGRQDLEGVLRFHRLSHMFVAPFVETESGDKDGIPTALLEGMSSGLPAVATDAGSIREVVDEGRDGLIVPQRQPEALADAIEALLADPARRAEFGRHAAASVRRRFAADTLERLFHERVEALLRR